MLGSGLGGEGFTTGQAVVRPFVGADYTNGITRGGNITYILRLQTFGSRSGQAYDPLGRLTAADYSTGESFEYTYDAVGNRLTYSGPDGTHTYTYDAANRLTSVDGVAYTWDDRGNLTNDGTFTYAYNGAGRLVRAESVTSTLVYTYTATGLRVAQSVDGEVTEFAWDWASGLPELLSEGGNLYLVGHETLGKWDGASWSYYLPDALGSVRQVTDGTGAVTAAREWTPYGGEIGGAQAGLGYTGEWQDAALGLTYLRARWYDAGTGRFTRRDVWEGVPWQPITLQPYLYADSDPIRYTDPTGTFAGSFVKWLRDKAEVCYADDNLDCVWNCYWMVAYGGQNLGYHYASRHLFQFLYKQGDIEYVSASRVPAYAHEDSSDWIRNSPSVQDELPLLEQESLHLIHTKAKNGTRSGDVRTPRRSVYPDSYTEKDLYYAMNVFSLWAEANYEIEGCYEVKVKLIYRFWDAYDWHKGLAAGGPAVGVSGFKDEWAAALHDAGLAEEYEISGWWSDPTKVYIFPSNWLALDVPPSPISVRTGRW